MGEALKKKPNCFFHKPGGLYMRKIADEENIQETTIGDGIERKHLNMVVYSKG